MALLSVDCPVPQGSRPKAFVLRKLVVELSMLKDAFQLLE